MGLAIFSGIVNLLLLQIEKIFSRQTARVSQGFIDSKLHHGDYEFRYSERICVPILLPRPTEVCRRYPLFLFG